VYQLLFEQSTLLADARAQLPEAASAFVAAGMIEDRLVYLVAAEDLRRRVHTMDD
jgi:hypothetical protein